MKRKLKIWIGVGIILGTLVITAFIWLSSSYSPMDEANLALQSDDFITVSSEKWITFTPNEENISTGMIFYPGGKVEPESYAPLLRKIAEDGYIVVLAPMPFNLAVFSPNQALKIIETYSTIENWAIGGHSLGGSMAAKFAYENPDLIQALMLYAAYPVESNDLSNSSLFVLSIYGSEDQVLSQSIPETAALLPASATIYEIEGGNHAYFGTYGEQKGDGVATITRFQQIAETVNQTLQILDLL
jgi:dienelactone hydrolase